jgi:hypothetical protein
LAACEPRPLPPYPREPKQRMHARVEVDPMVTTQSNLATADGFTYCCGNNNFKMEIQCDDGIKRCFENTQAGWEQTYGRHCKRTLGETCYLTTCERVCDRR